MTETILPSFLPHLLIVLVATGRESFPIQIPVRAPPSSASTDTDTRFRMTMADVGRTDGRSVGRRSNGLLGMIGLFHSFLWSYRIKQLQKDIR